MSQSPHKEVASGQCAVEAPQLRAVHWELGLGVEPQLQAHFLPLLFPSPRSLGPCSIGCLGHSLAWLTFCTTAKSILVCQVCQ